MTTAAPCKRLSRRSESASLARSKGQRVTWCFTPAFGAISRNSPGGARNVRHVDAATHDTTPFLTALRAAGSNAPPGANMFAASSGSGGGSSDVPPIRHRASAPNTARLDRPCGAGVGAGRSDRTSALRGRSSAMACMVCIIHSSNCGHGTLDQLPCAPILPSQFT
jgi:hypothetical protein